MATNKNSIQCRKHQNKMIDNVTGAVQVGQLICTFQEV